MGLVIKGGTQGSVGGFLTWMGLWRCLTVLLIVNSSKPSGDRMGVGQRMDGGANVIAGVQSQGLVTCTLSEARVHGKGIAFTKLDESHAYAATSINGDCKFANTFSVRGEGCDDLDTQNPAFGAIGATRTPISVPHQGDGMGRSKEREGVKRCVSVPRTRGRRSREIGSVRAKRGASINQLCRSQRCLHMLRQAYTPKKKQQ